MTSTQAATDNPELNFIVEHVGLPRIEDFCFMATQEPNVYAGLAVVLGGLMHARPRFFSKVMGELLFWVGEDKMLYGSDYGIWEPKWQIEGLLDWDYPDDTYSDYPRLNQDGKRKILGLNAAKLYGIEVPTGVPARRRDPGRKGGRTAGRVGMTTRDGVMDALAAVYDPELDEPITTLRFVSSCEVNADGDVQVALRLPTPQCAPNFAFLMAADARNVVRRLPGVRDVSVTLEDHYTGDEINAALNRGAGSPGRSRARPTTTTLSASRAVPAQGAGGAPGPRVRGADRSGSGRGADRADAGPRPARRAGASQMPRAPRAAGDPRGPDAPAFVAGDGTPVCAEHLERWLRMARLIATSLEANGGICRSLLQFRHGLADDPEEVRR